MDISNMSRLKLNRLKCNRRGGAKSVSKSHQSDDHWTIVAFLVTRVFSSQIIFNHREKIIKLPDI